MKKTSMTVDPLRPEAWPAGRCNAAMLDAATNADIARQQAEDDQEAFMAAAKYARRVRKRLGVDAARVFTAH